MKASRSFWRWLFRKTKPTKGWRRGKTYSAEIYVTEKGAMCRSVRSIIFEKGDPRR